MQIRLCAVLVLPIVTGQLSAQQDIDFNDQVRPILNRHCISCHGPDEGSQAAGLRLDNFEAATEYAIVPGDAEGSEAFERVTSEDSELRMPPAEHGDRLSDDEVEVLRRWINQGAKFARHWSFAPIKEPALPSISKTATVSNAIDRFIVRKVEAAGLQQNGAADPRNLVRRVSLDVTGLPPANHSAIVQDAINGFLEDPTIRNFENLVDRLLQTPAYAEHWASMWLDLARYADTCGYSGDEPRDIWPWRDWLVKALESDKSYKDLSMEMLAGDLLPDATDQQILATAFHRNTLSNNEGGTNDEEFRTIAVKDRLSTTLNVWMGLTVRCAECHSHKYDPISQVEYYQLLDFFNHTQDSDARDDRPKIAVPRSRDPRETQAIDAQIAQLNAQLHQQPKVWTKLQPEVMKSRNGTKFKILDDGSILAHGPKPKVEEYSFTFNLKAGESVSAIKLEAIPHATHNSSVGRGPEGAFILSQIRLAVDQESGEDAKPLSLPWKDATSSYHQGKHHAKTSTKLKVKSGGGQGWAVKHPVNGYRDRQEAVFELQQPHVAQEDSQFTIHLLFDPPWEGRNMGRVRLSRCEVDDAVAKYNKKTLDPVNRKIDELVYQRDTQIYVPVMRRREKTRVTHVMLRGNFQSHGEEVTASFPTAFTFGSDLPLNRLGLAQWLFDDANPLTARVAVNRYWARLMGVGLVETEEDFGTQGLPPSHPELLDFLAIQFRNSDWNSRALIKQIVMSATYQQSQQTDPSTLAADPRNRLLARGPRVRLSAEVIRDQALAVAGLLSNKMYGQPVYPPNPIKHVANAFTGGTTWQESEGEDRYRRALYTHLKRTAPHPLLDTFDVSSRDVCSMRRLRTNTPLQSFMTLNDVTFIEAARELAKQMLDHAGGEPSGSNELREDQIDHGIQLALYCSANESQLTVLANLYSQNVERFQQNLDSACELLGIDKVGDSTENSIQRNRIAQHAAMTLVANVILNLDTFMNN